MEIWGAEYQESNALLVRSEHKAVLQKIGIRERCPVSFVGTITGNGKVKKNRISATVTFSKSELFFCTIEFRPCKFEKKKFSTITPKQERLL